MNTGAGVDVAAVWHGCWKQLQHQKIPYYVLLEEQGMGQAVANCYHQLLGDIDILVIVLVRVLGCLNGATEVDFPLRKGMSPWWFGIWKPPDGACQVCMYARISRKSR